MIFKNVFFFSLFYFLIFPILPHFLIFSIFPFLIFVYIGGFIFNGFSQMFSDLQFSSIKSEVLEYCYKDRTLQRAGPLLECFKTCWRSPRKQ